jgi:hypothetical protein
MTTAIDRVVALVDDQWENSQAEDPTFPFITPHDLRHTAASLDISAGGNPKSRSTEAWACLCGMTLDTHADLFEDDLDAVSARLDATRSNAVVGFSWGNARQKRRSPRLLNDYRGLYL